MHLVVLACVITGITIAMVGDIATGTSIGTIAKKIKKPVKPGFFYAYK